MLPKHLSVRKLDDKANVDMILTAVVAGVMFAIAIPIIFSVSSGTDFTTLNDQIATGVHGYTNGPTAGDDANSSWANYNLSQDATNASDNLLTNVATFFTIGPIYLVVVAAVGIIAAVLMLRAR